MKKEKTLDLPSKEEEGRMNFARQRATTAWRYGEFYYSGRTGFAEEFTEILVIYMCEPHLGCATTGNLIDEIKARSDLEYTTIRGGKEASGE